MLYFVPMTNKIFPPEWDEERVRRVLDHYESQSDEEAINEDEKTSEEEVNLTLLSETSLATDWLRPEEDEAWSHLAQLPLL